MWTKAWATRAARGLRAGHWLLGLLGLLWACAGCDPVGNITVDAPTTDSATKAYYVDTLTVRVATVWHDSVLTSGGDNLLVGRYHDPRLGTLTARSYFQVGLGGLYSPAPDEVFDSLVLVLKPDGYRYGDTTQLQNLEVHRLRDALVATKNYYAFSQLAYDAAVLNQGRSTRALAVRPSVRNLRLRLADALGRELLSAGLAGSLTTDAELNSRLAGLVLTPGAADDAALLRTQRSTEGGALNLYTHSPTDPATVITKAFTLASGGQHFYQVTSDRTGTLLAPLTTSLQALAVARTAQEAYLDGVLGLQVKLEIPYLNDLRSFSSRLTIVQANLTLEVVPGSATRYLAPPGSLVAYLSGRGNQQGAAIGNSTTSALAIPYQSGISNVTGLETASYTFGATNYCQAVVDHTLDNNGILLAAGTGASPERVVLGGPGRSENRLKLGLYFLTH